MQSHHSFRKFSPTKISIFQRCKQQFYWTYIDPIEQEKTQRKEAMDIGVALHAGMATYLKNGSFQEICSSVWEELGKPTGLLSEEQLKLFQKLTKVLQLYIEQDKNFWKVESVELDVEVPFQVPSGRVILNGRWDAVILENDRRWIVDHKFSKNSISPKVYDYTWQSMLYLLQAKLMGLPAEGIIFNLINYSKAKFERKIVKFSENSFNSLEKELVKVIEEALRDFIPTRHFSHTCPWECPFSKMCLVDLERIEK
jgi:hypothetical protein